MILDVQGLSLGVQGKELLHNISFSLQEGERLGIVGLSGSGKTLLARSLIRLLPPSIQISGGSVVYRGQIVSKMTERELQKVRGKEIGMVFQDPLTFLNPTVKVGLQIMEGYRKNFTDASKQEAKHQTLRLLTQVGIPDSAHYFEQFPHQLSGGLRQRVLIAIALAGEPHLLIADEPTTALDTVVQAQIMKLLSTLLEDKTIILISHDLSLIATFCTRAIVMHEGQIVEDAPIEQLFSAPRHLCTKQLLQGAML